MKRVTKIARKKNNQFQTPLPIGTTSQYITVTDDKQTSLKDTLGNLSTLPKSSISESITYLAQRQGQGIKNATREEDGLMSSIDFKKINPQILSTEEDDLNNIKIIGWYRIIYDTTTQSFLVRNMPAEITSSCYMEVQQIKDGEYFQRIRDTSGIYYERQYTFDGLWSEWKKVLSEMVGASAATTGKSGLVPTPAAGKNSSFLRGDGTWQTPTNTWIANTKTQAGYVASPQGVTNKVWKTDANGNPGWGDGMSVMAGATPTAAGKLGAVPAPSIGQNTYLLQGDGTWIAPKKTYKGSTDGLLMSSTELWALNSLTGCSDGYRHFIQLIPPNAAVHGGYIDFHFGGSSEDYTARLIQYWKNWLYARPNLAVEKDMIVYNNLRVDNNLTVKQNLTVEGGITATKACQMKNTLYVKNEADGTTNHFPVTSSSAANGYTYLLSTNGKTYLKVVGRWGATSGSSTKNLAVSSSDIRLKQNIKENTTTSGLELINKIPLYEFDWKDSGKHQKLGFVADYLEKIDPNLSIGDKTEDENGNPIYKSVDTFYLQGFEIKAIQELSQQNDELKKEINLLKEEIKELKNK